MQLLQVSFAKYTDKSAYPFSLSLLAHTKSIDFTTPVTILVGENGCGKSTILEAIAVATKLPTVGATESHHDPSLQAAKKLADKMQLTWQANNHRGFFLRAEDFFGFQKRIVEMQAELRSQKQEYGDKFTGYARTLTVGSTQAQLGELEKKYGKDPDAFSHGESFLNLFASRLVPQGLYILDEPEVPLSPQRQLTFISMIKEQVAKGSQFIIATHSPILMALPEATILQIKDGKMQRVEYDDVEHVSLTRDFLTNPQAFVGRL